MKIASLGTAAVVALALSDSSLADGPAPRLVVAATPHDAEAVSSEVRVVDLATGTARSWGSVAHARGAVVRGDVRGEVAFVVSDEDGPGDRSWGAALYRADALGVRRLVGEVGRARRPLASVDGAVYVERGVAGTPPADARGGLRIDEVHVDAVDPSSGATRVVCKYSGYALHLAGETPGALVLYRVGPTGADVVTVDRGTCAVRGRADVPPFARDFSVEANTLVFADREGGGWTVERLDLATFTRTVVSTDPDQQSSPLALPGGGLAGAPLGTLALTARRRAGLSLGGKTFAPLGAGFDAPLFATDDARWLAVLHVSDSDFDATYALETASGRGVRVGATTERIDALGFVGARSGGAR